MISGDLLGAVYRAAERLSGRFFAVRFMAGQAGEEQTAMIEKEVELLIALPHPNILHVEGSGRRQNRLYIAMDYIEAPSLGQAKIQEIPRLTTIFREVAEAVHYAHEEGILHGDLNPENILVGRVEDRDHPYVKDFGLAHLLEGVGTQASSREPGPILRMPAYQAPEQKLSIASDVYSLGATFYAALAGRAPFEGQDAKQILTRARIGEPPPLERLRKDIPEALGVVIRRAMAKEPSLRYPTAKDMANSLKRILEGAVTAIRHRPPGPIPGGVRD
jgi:serine/threonine-protein kinase